MRIALILQKATALATLSTILCRFCPCVHNISHGRLHVTFFFLQDILLKMYNFIGSRYHIRASCKNEGCIRCFINVITKRLDWYFDDDIWMMMGIDDVGGVVTMAKVWFQLDRPSTTQEGWFLKVLVLFVPIHHGHKSSSTRRQVDINVGARNQY